LSVVEPAEGLPELLRRTRRLTPLAAANAASMLNSLAIAVLYTRLAGPGLYGVYQVAFAILGVVGILAVAGSGTAASRAAAQGRAAAWPLFRARLPFCFATSLGLAATAAVIELVDASALAPALLALAATIPLYLGADVYPAHLIGRGLWTAYLRFQLLVQGGILVGVSGALLADRRSPWLAVLAVGAVTGAIQAHGLARLRRGASAELSDLRYARQITGVAVLSALDARLDLLVAGALLGAREAGLVAIARTLPTLVRRTWEVLYQPFFVRMAAVGPIDAMEVARRFRRALVGVLGGASAVGIALAPIALPLVFGEASRDAVTLTQLLLGAVILMVVGFLDEVLLKAQGDIRRLRLVYVVLPVTSLVFTPLLVSLYGINGIGLEAILVAAVYVVLVTNLSRRSVAEAVAT
jgi:O-antigen/teichoic acid export membrane protein